MVVYRKKVSKRRRKRTGSKRKITKPRNKRMNRSRQMGGSADGPGVAVPVQAPGGAVFPNLTQAEEQLVADAVGTVVPPATDMTGLVIQRPNAEQPVNKAQTVDYANNISGALGLAIGNQKGLCNNIKGAIGNLINRVKKCESGGEPIDLSDLSAILNTILDNVLKLNGQCDGLGSLLFLLEQRLLAAGCLEEDQQDNPFDLRLGSIESE